MISVQTAELLRARGVRWHPASGDRFIITGRQMDEEVFTISEMTIEPHRFDTGTILGFNGTTEWALDSVATERTLWLPREDQLREILGPTFRSLNRQGEEFEVVAELAGEPVLARAHDAAEAYAQVVLGVLERVSSTDDGAIGYQE